jgi:hypothetical protein
LWGDERWDAAAACQSVVLQHVQRV